LFSAVKPSLHLYFERSKRIVDEARLAHEQLGEMLTQPSGVLRISLPVARIWRSCKPMICSGSIAAKSPMRIHTFGSRV
jgi:hypothetical protein